MGQTMKICYVAGPYSATSFSEVHLNIWHARKYAIEIWESGAAAICPHLNTFHFEEDTDLTQQDFYDGDNALLARSDAVFLIPGWERSKGAKMEKEFAEQRGIPVFFSLDLLRDWLRRSEADELAAKGATE
jgi:hypothetical protein